MARRYDTISVLSDYGTDDEFAGVLRAVLRDLAPDATVIDLTHGIAPYDVRGGSLALARSIAYVPVGIVMAIVDPGVATERRASAVEVAGGDGVLIGPDNGLLAPAVALAGGAERAVELTNADFQLAAPGATFAGRDIFAPAAAHLCNGIELTELGPLLDVELLMPGVVPLVQADDERVIAQVLWVDRFGNAQLNVAPDDLAETFGEQIEVRVEHPTAGTVTRSARRVRAFAELGGGEVGLVLDSTGLLALVLDQRSAAEELELAPGDQVTLTPGADDDGPGLTQPVGTPPRR